MHKSPWLILLVSLGLAVVAGAQTVPLTQNALVNRDVVTLAKAGFNEDFIIDLIHTSQTHFDMSVNGLTELAKEGLTERLIRVMMGAGAGPGEAGALPPPLAAVTVTSAAVPEPHEHTQVLRRSEAAVALANQTPYRHSSSMLWGLWRKEINVGAAPHANPVAPQLGKAYGQVHRTNPVPGNNQYVVFP